ncbi:DUF6193 family natural product biosynthesis protein [Streptomyces sp. NBC_00257]|uniref:DUF6193 family natural product biosynthesis protein n=1 Tax=unclassified Streptomyces TaxID=2593676 RepID=UPI00225BD46A|nr:MULTISPECIES: DUF6193 family natural product biosynthesis protein [unclassified Streptomyces]WTB58752.1 DUF6193 family natural product biosynthesis protein [Streptomyces sp. NBC_00826]WTH88371.1 DUF6193 family natural product biosynthesis protein [Streptomyces sp. NBC_00825]WTH97100.1 DUF6193 family natural product biosynthesis protein [Streptomyces sp. NBC_00822]MCX4862591.1 DUF6193 family natural product biosynthesis protein [Streptomyces sp. NBC_00906]MCX4893828.1 DUF6193 family natural 
MTTHPDRAVLYPDVAARGSLAAALQAVAEERGFAVSVTPSGSSSLSHASAESGLPHRKALLVSSWAAERRWSIRGEETFAGSALIEGDTDDLAQVAVAARAWQDGAALSEIRHAAPFVRLTGRFEVPDPDPQHLTESEWQFMRTEAEERGRPTYQALIEAAYAEPALRRLYPFTSHWTLRFSTTTRPSLTLIGPCLLAADADQGYRVSTGFTGRGLLTEAATAQEAVAAAVRHLPDEPGSVTLGVIRDVEHRGGFGA